MEIHKYSYHTNSYHKDTLNECIHYIKDIELCSYNELHIVVWTMLLTASYRTVSFVYYPFLVQSVLGVIWKGNKDERYAFYAIYRLSIFIVLDNRSLVGYLYLNRVN